MSTSTDSVTHRDGVARNIVAARVAAGHTQASLAEAIGVDRTIICRTESGRSPVTVDRLFDIAVACGVQPCALIAA